MKIKERERKEVQVYKRVFQRIGDFVGNGYSFNADNKGNPVFEEEYKDRLNK